MGEGGVKGGGHIGGRGGRDGRDGTGGRGVGGHIGGLSLGHSHFLNDKKSKTLKLIQS